MREGDGGDALRSVLVNGTPHHAPWKDNKRAAIITRGVCINTFPGGYMDLYWEYGVN